MTDKTPGGSGIPSSGFINRGTHLGEGPGPGPSNDYFNQQNRRMDNATAWPDKPAKPSPTDNLSDRLQNLTKAISILEGKLEPVLTPDGPGVDSPREIPAPWADRACSPLSHQIQQHTAQIYNLS